jgi:serine phosphatase RsbU (regulator of sigma subunit)/Tfp pilus assembly protein PilF
LGISPLILSQNFADKKTYLIDSLELDLLTQPDIILLDSCIQKYHKSASDSARINAIGIICENMSDQSWIRYQQLQLNEIYTALEKKDSYFLQKSLGNAFNNLGFYHDMQGEIKTARIYYSNALDKFKEIEYQPGMAISNNNLGYLCQMEGNIVKALDHYHQSLLISEKAGDVEGLAFCSNNIGIIYDNQGDYEKALEYYEKSLQYEREIENQSGIATSLSNLGYLYNNLGEKEKALQFFLQAFEIRQEINDLGGMANSMNNIGSYYKEKKNYTKAMEYFSQSLEYNTLLGNKPGFVTCYINIGGVYFAQNDLNNAEIYADKSLNLARELGYPEDVERAALLNSLVASANNKWKKAYQMHLLYLEMRDSTLNEKTTKSAMQLQFKIEYAKKSAADSIKAQEEIKVKNAEIAANKAESEKLRLISETQDIYFWVLVIGLAFVVVVALVINNRFKHTKKQNIIIAEQNIQSEKLRKKVENQHLLLEETHQEMSDSIKYAERLQQAILPSKDDLNANLGDGFVLFKPKDVVSGDFYWMYKLQNEVLVAVADCTGHGVPGALVSVVCSNALNRCVKEFGLSSPSDILDKTRELVIETFTLSGQDVRDGMDIALCSFSDGKVVFSGANNPLWIVRSISRIDTELKSKFTVFEQGGFGLIECKGSSQPVGLYDVMDSFKQNDIELMKDDSIYLFTDGYADQFGGKKGKKLMYKPFKKLLLEINTLPMEAQKEKLEAFFNEWRGENEQVDDVCIIGVKV